MNTFLTTIGLVIVLGLLFHRRRIMRFSSRNSSDTKKWPELTRSYKLHLRWSLRMLIGIWLLLLPTALLAPVGYPQAYQDIFSSSPAFAVSFLVIFFTGTIRLLIEDSSDDPRRVFSVFRSIIQSFKNPRRFAEQMRALGPEQLTDSAKEDGSTAWFFMTLLLSSIPTLTWNSTYSRLLAVFANTVACLGYFAWIYLTIFNRLVKRHHLSDLTARAFTGNINDDDTPKQAVIIGPELSGKSSFVIGGKATRETGGTRYAEVRIFKREGQFTTMIDTPGENLGDHLFIVTKYRTDDLVLILNLTDLDSAKADNDALYSIENCADMFRPATPAHRYLVALQRATKRDNKAFPAADIFKVYAFVLFINYPEEPAPEHKAMAKRFNEPQRLKLLADSIGNRFGVGKENCKGFIGVATHSNEGREVL